MLPTRFLKTDSLVEVQFLDNDIPRWYKGIVKKIDGFDEDDIGTYVVCTVLYEDDELVEDTVLYDCNFEEENGDGWRLQHDNSKLIKMLHDNTSSLKKILDTSYKQEDDTAYESDDTYDSDTDSDTDVNHLNFAHSVVATMMGFSISILALTLSYKIANTLGFC